MSDHDFGNVVSVRLNDIEFSLILKIKEKTGLSISGILKRSVLILSEKDLIDDSEAQEYLVLAKMKQDTDLRYSMTKMILSRDGWHERARVYITAWIVKHKMLPTAEAEEYFIKTGQAYGWSRARCREIVKKAILEGKKEVWGDGIALETEGVKSKIRRKVKRQQGKKTDMKTY